MMTQEERQVILDNADWFGTSFWSVVTHDGQLHL